MIRVFTGTYRYFTYKDYCDPKQNLISSWLSKKQTKNNENYTYKLALKSLNYNE